MGGFRVSYDSGVGEAPCSWKREITDMISPLLMRTKIDSKRMLMELQSSSVHLAHVIRFLERGIPKQARSFIQLFKSEVGKMEFTSNAERLGFAPSDYVCPYHIWKPRGVLRTCTCSPAPDQQVTWEKKVFDSDAHVAARRLPIEPGVGVGRGSFGGIDRGSIAIFCRTSGQALVSALRTARKGVAGRLLHVSRL